MIYPNSASTEIRSRLKLRSTVRGANNRLDVDSIVSYDRCDGSVVPIGELLFLPDQDHSLAPSLFETHAQASSWSKLSTTLPQTVSLALHLIPCMACKLGHELPELPFFASGYDRLFR